MLTKQAKILTDEQIKRVLGSLDAGRNAARNKVMFLLSLHGLRAKEIASLELSMITDADGVLSSEIALQDKASKGKSGRIVFMSPVRNSRMQRGVWSRHSNTKVVRSLEFLAV